MENEKEVQEERAVDEAGAALLLSVSRILAARDREEDGLRTDDTGNRLGE